MSHGTLSCSHRHKRGHTDSKMFVRLSQRAADAGNCCDLQPALTLSLEAPNLCVLRCILTAFPIVH